MDDESFIKHIAQELKTRPLSLFLGAGIGADAGLPTWNQLFDCFREELGIEDGAAVSNPLLAQYYANEKGGSLQSLVAKYIGGNVNSSKLLKQALALEPSDIWTLDYDQVIERTLEELGRNYNSVHSERNLTSVFPTDRVMIYKIGGEINALADALITQNSFEKFGSEHVLFETFLKKEFVTNTFLFLGYSFEDGIAQRSLRLIAEVLGDAANMHYTIMKRDSLNPRTQEHFIKDLEKRYRIRTLLVEDYNEIGNVLGKIREEMLKDRVFISGSLWNPELIGEQNVYEICKAVALALISSGFTVVSGLGYNVGYYISGALSEYCLQRGLKLENHLILNPYAHDCSEKDQSKWREKLIGDSNAVVFLYGQTVDEDGTPIVSQGVLEEYDIAMELEKPIIPIGSTKYAAAQILEFVKKEPDRYPYLEPNKTIDKLENETDPSELANLVSCLLKNIKGYQACKHC